MKAYECNKCGAQSKIKEEFCGFCRKKADYFEIELPDPTEEDLRHSRKFEEAVDILTKYEEGTQKRKLEGCGCRATESSVDKLCVSRSSTAQRKGKKKK